MRALCLLTVVLAALTLAGGGGGAPTKPALRIEGTYPLLVGGTAFRRGEVVRVQADGAFGTRAGRVRATAGGGFRLRFAKLTGDPCVLRSLSAVGSRGSRAALRVPPGACVEG